MPPLSLSRRTLLTTAGGATFATLAGCLALPSSDSAGAEATPRNPVDPNEADQRRAISAVPGTISPGSNATTSSQTWLYDDQEPGPEFRVTEGDVLRVDLTNRLPDSTTIHWHGIPLANPMDGVPDVTQAPVQPDEAFTYAFEAAPAGTYFYHSHVGLQLDRHLIGPLIVEEKSPHVAFDRDVVVVFNDYLASAPRPESEWADGNSGGMMGGMGGGMGGVSRPNYAGLLANGRLLSNPPEFTVQEGERLRFRFINASGATTFRVGVGGHPLRITHADGRPVDPVRADSFVFGAGERYDAIVEANNRGTWTIQARPVDGDERPATATLRYEGSTGRQRTPSFDGRQLEYSDLRATESLQGVQGTPDRTYDVGLTAGNDPGTWLIDGQQFPDADPLQVRTDEHVRIRMTNRSPMVHPMHLHGHFFRVGDALKDTVMVPPHMGQVTIDFVADNPGKWLFHCHNIYHFDGGMARVITYVE